MKKLICYRINDDAPSIVPARSERAWMDATRFRYAYRCLPLTIANSMGWELLCPTTITASWNGGPELDDMKVIGGGAEDVAGIAQSHFGHGILTFHTRYLFRTDPGVALWARGAPNLPKDGIAALDGIIETDWLNFGFTMNWLFTRPGRVTFEKDEPFCFITPIGYHALDELVPEIAPISADPELAKAHQDYVKRRKEFGAAELDSGNLKGRVNLRREALACDRVVLVIGDGVGHLGVVADLDEPGVVDRDVFDDHAGANAPGAPFGPKAFAIRLGGPLDDEHAPERNTALPQVIKRLVELLLAMEKRRIGREVIVLRANEDRKSRRTRLRVGTIHGEGIDPGAMKRGQELDARHDAGRIVEAAEARGGHRAVEIGGKTQFPRGEALESAKM